MKTFTLPLPPTSNHAYRPTERPGKLAKTDATLLWESLARGVVGNCQPLPRTPLGVSITLYLARLHGSDIDGRVKLILDAVIGKRRDQWVDYLRVVKRLAATEERAFVEVGKWEDWMEGKNGD